MRLAVGRFIQGCSFEWTDSCRAGDLQALPLSSLPQGGSRAGSSSGDVGDASTWRSRSSSLSLPTSRDLCRHFGVCCVTWSIGMVSGMFFMSRSLLRRVGGGDFLCLFGFFIPSDFRWGSMASEVSALTYAGRLHEAVRRQLRQREVLVRTPRRGLCVRRLLRGLLHHAQAFQRGAGIRRSLSRRLLQGVHSCFRLRRLFLLLFWRGALVRLGGRPLPTEARDMF